MRVHTPRRRTRRSCEEKGQEEEEEEQHTGKSLEVEPVEEAIQAIHCLCLTWLWRWLIFFAPRSPLHSSLRTGLRRWHCGVRVIKIPWLICKFNEITNSANKIRNARSAAAVSSCQLPVASCQFSSRTGGDCHCPFDSFGSLPARLRLGHTHIETRTHRETLAHTPG